MTDVSASLDDARVESAVVLDHVVALEPELGTEACRGGGGGVEDAVVSDADVAGEPG